MKFKILILMFGVGMFLFITHVNASPLYSTTYLFFNSECDNIGTNQTLCEAIGCYWWGGLCNSFPQILISIPEKCFKLSEDLTICVLGQNKYRVIVTAT
jgi:hypothetical protein